MCLRLKLALLLCLSLAGLPLGQARAQEATLRGFITDQSTGEPLQGANVIVRDTSGAVRGAVSEPNGLYQISALAPGRYGVRVSFVGYAAHTDTLRLAPGQIKTLNVALTPTEQQLEEVVVSSKAGAATIQGGEQTVRPADIQRIPTPDVSGDLASYLTSLPSVVSAGDRGGQLFIRGGTASQNLVLIDGTLVYQPFHIIGFFSAFPQDLVANADVYAGGFGARYSGRISSVIDVSMREGNKQQFEGAASLSPYLASARIEGPIREGKMSMIGSVRHSIIEQAEPLYSESFPFQFGDQFLKLHSIPQENSRYSITALHTYDRGRIDTGDTDRNAVFRWRNLALAHRLVVLPSTVPILFEMNNGISYVRNAVGTPDRPERSSEALRLNTELHLTRTMRRLEFDWGFFARMQWSGFTLGEQFANIEIDSDVLFGVGGYLDTKISLTDRFDLTPGLALSWYPTTYTPSAEPRVRLAWHPHPNHTFSAAAGLYRQPIVGVSDERDTGSVFVAWMPAPEGQHQPQAVHVLGGWQGQFGPIQLAAEGYYKHLSHLSVPRWSARARFTTDLTLASGNVYGVDTRLGWQRGPLYTYLGYGFSWTRYTATQDDLAMWFGEPIQAYHPPHDRRHQLNAVLSLDLGMFTTNVRWEYGSGLPFTQPIGFDEFIPPRGVPDVQDDFGEPRLIYEKPYQGRLPAYHRLDISVERAIDLGSAELTLQAGGINVYDRNNLFYFDLFTVQRVDQLPLVPYLSLKLATN